MDIFKDAIAKELREIQRVSKHYQASLGTFGEIVKRKARQELNTPLMVPKIGMEAVMRGSKDTDQFPVIFRDDEYIEGQKASLDLVFLHTLLTDDPKPSTNLQLFRHSIAHRIGAQTSNDTTFGWEPPLFLDRKLPKATPHPTAPLTCPQNRPLLPLTLLQDPSHLFQAPTIAQGCLIHPLVSLQDIEHEPMDMEDDEISRKWSNMDVKNNPHSPWLHQIPSLEALRRYRPEIKFTPMKVRDREQYEKEVAERTLFGHSHDVEPITPDFTSEEFNYAEEDLSKAPRPLLDSLIPPPRLETDDQPLPGFMYPEASSYHLVETRQFQRRYIYVAPIDLNAINKDAERERLMSVIEPPELRPKEVDGRYVVGPVPALVRPPPGVPLVLEVTGSPGDFITIFAVHTLESLRYEPEFNAVYRDCVLVMQGLCGADPTDNTGDYPGVPRGLVDMGMQHNNRSANSFNIASTLVQVGEGIFAPAAQNDSLEFLGVSGTVLAALSRIKEVVTKKTFSLFEQKTMEFNSLDNNVIGCGGTQWSNATNVQVNITSLQQSLRNALAGQGKMHPDPGSHGGTFVEARTGAYVDDEECWPRILVFDATRPHAGSDLLSALKEADEVIAETAQRAWRLKREVRFGVVAYTKSAAQERSAYMSITPTVGFGNNSFAPAHITRERNFAQHGEAILGGADALGIRLGRELLFSFHNFATMANLTFEEDLNVLAAKVKYKNDKGELVSIGPLPFNPQYPENREHMKRMRGLVEYRFRQHVLLHVYLLRAGFKKAHVQKHTLNSKNMQQVGLTHNVFSTEDADEHRLAASLDGNALEILAITEVIFFPLSRSLTTLSALYRKYTGVIPARSYSVPSHIIKQFFRKCAPHLLPDEDDDDMPDVSVHGSPDSGRPTSPEQRGNSLAPMANLLGNTGMMLSTEELTGVHGPPDPETEDEMDNAEGDKLFITSIDQGTEFHCYVCGAEDPQWIIESRLRIDAMTLALVESYWTKLKPMENPAVPGDLGSQRRLRDRKGKGKEVVGSIGASAAISSSKRKRTTGSDSSSESDEQSEDLDEGAFAPTGRSSAGSDSDSDFNPVRPRPLRKRRKKQTDQKVNAMPVGLDETGAIAKLLQSKQIEHECDALERDLQRIKPTLLKRTKVIELMTVCSVQNRMFSLLQVGANTAALDVLSRTSMQLETLRGATETLHRVADGEALINLLSVKNGVPASPLPPVACLDTKRNQSGLTPHCGEPTRSQRVPGQVEVGKPKRIGDEGQDREHQGRVGPSQRDSTSHGQEASVNNHQGLARMGYRV
ncbi:hypothetical protein C8F01DRAFT_1095653 [Mycena amicta]|nr:hypothetical protein C8F01DRAFT_1095653 [Mycena amicta]